MNRVGIAQIWVIVLGFSLVAAGCVSGKPAQAPAAAPTATVAAVSTVAVEPPASATDEAAQLADAGAEDAPGGDAPDDGALEAATVFSEPTSPALVPGTATPKMALESGAAVATAVAVATAAPGTPTEVANTPTTVPATVLAAASTPALAATPTVTTTRWSTDPNPLQIEVMRQQSYPGSEITVEQTLAPGANYNQYVVSYQSDGYKIYALMTVPNGPKPATGWPAIVFNHGYIPPAQYRTTERYVAYVDAIARAGYIVFKSDYRGHGISEGPTVGGGNGGPWGGGYGSPGYTNDVLNALASLKAYPDADPNRIGMWGHSLGGQVTLRAMVVSKDIKAGVIWGGVVAPYPDIFARGNRPFHPGRPTPNPNNPLRRRGWQQELTAKYGTVQQNPAFWASISPNSYLADISGPVQLDHSTTDEEVPVETSETLYKELQDAGKTVELYTYAGDNHNINGNFWTAMQRSIAFFDKYVKGS